MTDTMKTKVSQNKCILKYLMRGGALTAAKALDMCGCSRLAARIFELKRAGNLIFKTTVVSNGARFARYKLGAAKVCAPVPSPAQYPNGIRDYRFFE